MTTLSGQTVADIFDVPYHLLTYDLPPGYWRRQEARQVARRRLRTRLRRWIVRRKRHNTP